MKRLKIILILILLFITGCFAPKTELDKFKSYLKKNYDYKCKENICTKVASVGKLIESEEEIDFYYNTIQTIINGNGGLNVTKKMYHWTSNTSTYESNLLGIKVNAVYDHITKEINCSSEHDDKEYVDLECRVAQRSLEELKTNFEKIIDESGTTYFDA